jgi:LVIVD repeat
MRRPRPLFVFLFAALAVLVGAAFAAANHGFDGDNGSNMTHVANSPKAGTTNSDLAFWGNLAFAGNYGGFRILDISNPSSPQVLSDFSCNGPQSDVAVYGNANRLLLFLSIDRRQVKPGTLIPEPGCSSANDPTRAIGFEGIRIIDVTDPAHPQFVKGVETDCGSHTHTLVPDAKRNRVFIYVSSYPLNDHGADAQDECVAPHNKISVVEVPLARPAEARVVSQPSVGSVIGCHDIGVFLPTKRAAAACLTEGQIWDISNPVKPVVIHRIVNAQVNIWHSGSFSWDGKLAIFGDEEGGAAANRSCTPPSTPPGAIWFYDSSTAALKGSFALPRQQALPPESDDICTAHNYVAIPAAGRSLLVSAFYEGGTSVIDFSNPGNAREISYFDLQGVDGNPEAFTWSSYWYNGFIYTNDIDRGVDVFALSGEPARLARNASRFSHLNPQTQERRLRSGDD